MRITYIEDPDSLRFALGVMDFDLSKAQPHFPGYPPFIFLVKIFYWISKNVSLSFTIVGGLMSCISVYSLHQIFTLLRHRNLNPWVTALTAFTPLIWIMSNRFMADSTGLAILLSTLWIGFRYLTKHEIKDLIIYTVLVGLLAGVRLSYLPFLFPLSLLLISKFKTLHWQILGYSTGFIVWLLPTIALMGWNEFWIAGSAHSAGHFNDWGGTLSSSTDGLRRVIYIPQDIFTHGLGFWWTGRHWITIPITAIGITGILLGLRTQRRSVLLAPLFFGLLSYFIWIYLYQNIEFKARHILPFLPFVGFYLFNGLASFKSRQWILAASVPIIGFAGFLAFQHKTPSSMAQTIETIDSSEQTAIITNELVGFMIERKCEDKAIVPLDYQGPVLSVQNKLRGRSVKDSTVFTHNPYVNKMWPTVMLYEYE